MKVVSTHFILKGKTDYKDLEPVFPQMLRVLLEDIGQMPEEEEILKMYEELNLADIRANRKPEGYNRKGKVRLVFPIGRKEFYLKSYEKFNDLKTIVAKFSDILTDAGIDFEIVDGEGYMNL